MSQYIQDQQYYLYDNCIKGIQHMMNSELRLRKLSGFENMVYQKVSKAISDAEEIQHSLDKGTNDFVDRKIDASSR